MNNLDNIIKYNDECVSKFISLVNNEMKNGIQSIYNDTKKNNKERKKILKEFQQNLSNIPKWSENVLENEYKRIKILSKCDYFDDLIKNIFKSYFKVLFLIKKKREKLTVPSSTKVIHSCYISLAREVWKKPILFYHKLDKKEIQKNHIEINKLIDRSIKTAIKDLLPFQEILANYLDNEDMESDDDYDDFEEYDLNEINKDNTIKLQEDFIEENKILNGDDDKKKNENENNDYDDDDSEYVKVNIEDINNFNESENAQEKEKIENIEDNAEDNVEDNIEDNNTEEGKVEDVVEDNNTEEGKFEDVVEDNNTEEGKVEDVVEDNNTEEGKVEHVVEDNNTEEGKVEDVVEDVKQIKEEYIEKNKEVNIEHIIQNEIIKKNNSEQNNSEQNNSEQKGNTNTEIKPFKFCSDKTNIDKTAINYKDKCDECKDISKVIPTKHDNVCKNKKKIKSSDKIEILLGKKISKKEIKNNKNLKKKLLKEYNNI